MIVPSDQGSGAAGNGDGGRTPRGLMGRLKGPGFVMSSRRLWLASIALERGGHRFLARWLKNFNSMLYHNSLPPQVEVSPDIRLGHQGFGTILHANVTIGANVKIFHNVTMFVRPTRGSNRIVIEDDVIVGAGAILMTPKGEDLHIRRGARVGAGAVVTRDVPERTIAISRPVEYRRRGGGPLWDEDALDDDAAALETADGE